jgi:hypothetical protein
MKLLESEGMFYSKVFILGRENCEKIYKSILWYNLCHNIDRSNGIGEVVPFIYYSSFIYCCRSSI